MDINEILNLLGIDLANPEAKRGAIEAIQAILNSRTPPASLGMGGAGAAGNEKEIDVELDPDLVQPSQKFNPPYSSEDIEIEDEEDILSQIKRNESEDDFDDDRNSSGDDSSSDSESDSASDADMSDSGDSTDDEEKNAESGEDSPSPSSSDKTGEEAAQEEDDSSDGTEDDMTGEEEREESENNEGSTEEAAEAEESEDEESEDPFEDEEDFEDEEIDEYDAVESEAEAGEELDDASEFDEFDEFDEDDFLDDELKNSYDDQGLRTKREARKIKRERTLAAAKTALDKAKAKNASQSLVRELEKAIEALESLTEAKAKNLADISDEEFNLMINRVFDAMSAIGDTDLTFTSDEERELKAQEIKTDLGSRETQQELSDEDIAAIRAETQAVKAREKETAQYKKPTAGSFKGFKEFLNSLYRAIALQVQTNEIQDDTWSAINRRYSGTGVLKQGQRKNDLPDKKIPIIDFYFDQSGSWDEKDIAAGKKAVEALVDMEEKGQIKINIYYFSDDVFTDAESARAAGGTSGWNEIVKNVIATQATNVVIMTDSDMESWWKGPNALKYTVPGYVWYLWRGGSNAPRLPRDLKGRGGVQQFSFNRGDV